MPTDTPAILPPDLDRPGRYWMTRTGWNIGKRVEIWEWSPAEPLWRHEQWGPMSPDLAGKAGYTLASPHPIPAAAALDAVYALATPPTGPDMPASPFAVGYVAGMGYLAHKLRAALEDRE